MDSELKESIKFNINHYEEVVNFHNKKIKEYELEIEKSNQVIYGSELNIKHLKSLLEEE